ncbi:APH(3') family aminoglycoside O-phosphotransferase [Chloroflexus sp.]|uniref:APH(3') family aminoglycoside O-phosphotransferase n=1 Tax=Chloroflexus sp. TaxID=1904827 RepID=UPI002ADE41A1|nr:APH(3') family aminoglycoside O-phosphotransferase [Chloroflexus sp.]
MLRSHELPIAVQRLLQGSSVELMTDGCSAAQVYRIEQDSRCMYLKMQSLADTLSLHVEARILDWLQGKLPVPEVLVYVADDRYEYLVSSEVAGQNGVRAMATLRAEALVELMASGLRMIHALDPATCPFDAGLELRLMQARANVLNGLVDETDFDPERLGSTTAQDILAALERERPATDDLVFTHGDYCLPNIIVCDGMIGGFIDWGRAGVADRYNDLAIASRSIHYHLGPQYEQYFFACYGLEQVDAGKIAYYRMLDELF